MSEPGFQHYELASTSAQQRADSLQELQRAVRASLTLVRDRKRNKRLGKAAKVRGVANPDRVVQP